MPTAPVAHIAAVCPQQVEGHHWALPNHSRLLARCTLWLKQRLVRAVQHADGRAVPVPQAGELLGQAGGHSPSMCCSSGGSMEK